MSFISRRLVRVALLLVVLCALILLTQTASAAVNDWSFVNGSGDYLNESGVYADATPANNHPGSRALSASWKDASGALWLFGGYGVSATNAAGDLNDLWKYDPDTNIWTFVNGSGDYQDELGVYADADPANNRPGSRRASATWIDANGDFWLFGGRGYSTTIFALGRLNDLWKYDPDTNIWTFVNGSGDYLDELGVYADADPANNRPGSREGSTAWIDASGDFWLFGGVGYTASGPSTLNDLWKYDPDTNIWTFVNGSGDYGQEAGVYADANPANNHPGSRYASAVWTDANGDVWLFGGHGYGTISTFPSQLNDLWKYDPDTNIWTFVSGSGDYRSEFGVYADADPANNRPGSRRESAAWTDVNGDFWLSGGFGYAASGDLNDTGDLNDLWKYDPDTNLWTVVNGSGDYLDEFGVYADATPANNRPGSRRGSPVWTDASGDVWLFGGYGYAASGSVDYLNDLWKFDGPELLVGTAPEITSAASATFTEGMAGSFTITATGDPAPTFSIAETLPAGLSLDTSTGEISGTPDTGTAGIYPLTITASNGVAPDATQGFTLTIDSLAAPDDLTATSMSATQIDLNWSDNSSDETSFRIERSLDGSTGWTEIGTNAADDTTYSDTGLACYTMYYYRVRAYRSDDGQYSNFTSPIASARTLVCGNGIFADVPVAGKGWMQQWIEAFYNAGITGGCGVDPLIYCPEREVTRAEMAVFVVRAIHYPNLPYTPTDPDDHFADVPVMGKEWMRSWIEEFFDLGITTGCGQNPLIFCPEQSVTRAEMAVFLLRALEGGSYQPPAASHYFADVPVAGKAWMEPWIDEFYRRGITGGCSVSPLNYCPERAVTRAEMAVFINRAFVSIPNP